jgi:SAM-dependent methyltransferase
MLPLSKQNAYRKKYATLRPGWRASGDEFESLTRQHITPSARVLDLGCGRGGVMELFWRDVRLSVGLDPDLSSLIEHRTRSSPGAGRPSSPGLRLPPLTCALGDALPFPAQSFDLVVALWVLEHLAQPERVFAEINRVLVPGGHFLFLTPNALHPLILFNRFSWAFPAVQRLLIPKLYDRAEADTFRVRYRANTLSSLRRLAAAHGFNILSLRAISDPTYLAFNDLFFQLSIMFESLLPEGWGVHLVGEWEKAGG